MEENSPAVKNILENSPQTIKKSKPAQFYRELTFSTSLKQIESKMNSIASLISPENYSRELVSKVIKKTFKHMHTVCKMLHESDKVTAMSRSPLENRLIQQNDLNATVNDVKASRAFRRMSEEEEENEGRFRYPIKICFKTKTPVSNVIHCGESYEELFSPDKLVYNKENMVDRFMVHPNMS